MKTNNRTVAMFHIGRGGQFHNQGHLTFLDFKPIDECYDWGQNTFHTPTSMDEAGNELPDTRYSLTDCNGNELMSEDELEHAESTGIGRLDFDGDYDTTYTTYVDELTESELRAMVKQPAAYGVKEALKEFGYTDEEVEVAYHFDDFHGGFGLLDYAFGNERNGVPFSKYLEDNYEVLDVEPEEGDYAEVNGKYYAVK